MDPQHLPVHHGGSRAAVCPRPSRLFIFGRGGARLKRLACVKEKPCSFVDSSRFCSMADLGSIGSLPRQFPVRPRNCERATVSIIMDVRAWLSPESELLARLCIAISRESSFSLTVAKSEAGELTIEEAANLLHVSRLLTAWAFTARSWKDYLSAGSADDGKSESLKVRQSGARPWASRMFF